MQSSPSFISELPGMLGWFQIKNFSPVGDTQEVVSSILRTFVVDSAASTDVNSLCCSDSVSSACLSWKPSKFSETMSLLSRDGVQTGCGDGLLQRIRAQLEEMFTDAHLAEDGFLLKHLQSRHGFVSLKLLTCLKKIKTLTTDWTVTLEAAVTSDLLEVNDERTKLRRKRPLPRWLLCSPTSKLLLIWNAGEEQTRGAEHRSLLQKLGLLDSITGLWVLHPGEELPEELQCYTKRHQELGQHVCTVVKFDLLEKVRRAYKALRAEDGCNGLRVVALGCRSTCKFTKPAPCEDSNTPQDEDRSSPDRSSPVELHEPDPPTEPLENVNLEKSVVLPGENDLPINMCSGDSSDDSPWVLKRRSTARHSITLRVLRQPVGPNGGRGFHPRRRDQNRLLPS